MHNLVDKPYPAGLWRCIILEYLQFLLMSSHWSKYTGSLVRKYFQIYSTFCFGILKIVINFVTRERKFAKLSPYLLLYATCTSFLTAGPLERLLIGEVVASQSNRICTCKSWRPPKEKSELTLQVKNLSLHRHEEGNVKVTN